MVVILANQVKLSVVLIVVPGTLIVIVFVLELIMLAVRAQDMVRAVLGAETLIITGVRA